MKIWKRAASWELACFSIHIQLLVLWRDDVRVMEDLSYNLKDSLFKHPELDRKLTCAHKF